ncbi:hypothetical protein GJ744_000731 [Endocarpon pusillum]|uniref:Uncharacterized protein n=1 Tax=Endocarpon pusillum TaxID=364733 RepID=A0A8H7ACF5_9EURO|nr:hypothetical protein GJ744_000731 [Endocarpon pusillum]
MYGGGRYGGLGGYGGMGGSMGGGQGPGLVPTYQDLIDEYAAMRGMSGTSGMPAMDGWPGTSTMSGIDGPQANRIMAACDPMQMGDVKRGAQALLRRLEIDPQGAAMMLQQVGCRDVATAVRSLRAQLIAIITGNGQGGSMMPGEGGDPMGGWMPGRWPGAANSEDGVGMDGGMPGGPSGTFPGATSPWMAGRMEGSRTRFQGGPNAYMGNESRSQSAFRGPHNLNTGCGPYRHVHFNYEEDIGEERRGSGLRGTFSGGRHSSEFGAPGGGESSGSSMFGDFFGFGRL